MYYVYVIQSKLNGQFYIGYTPDLNNRLSEHNEGKVRSTSPYVPYELIYYEAYHDKADAFKREKMLQYHGQGFRRLKERIQNSLLSKK